MAERPIDQLTLREMFTNAEGLIRDLSGHLKQSFQYKLRVLDDVVKSYKVAAERDAIPDATLRTNAAALLSSDDYSQVLFQKLNHYLTAIEERSQAAISSK